MLAIDGNSSPGTWMSVAAVQQNTPSQIHRLCNLPLLPYIAWLHGPCTQEFSVRAASFATQARHADSAQERAVQASTAPPPTDCLPPAHRMPPAAPAAAAQPAFPDETQVPGPLQRKGSQPPAPSVEGTPTSASLPPVPPAPSPQPAGKDRLPDVSKRPPRILKCALWLAAPSSSAVIKRPMACSRGPMIPLHAMLPPIGIRCIPAALCRRICSPQTRAPRRPVGSAMLHACSHVARHVARLQPQAARESRSLTRAVLQCGGAGAV